MLKQLPPILSLSGLRIERGTTLILHDLSWQVERGQHWVILGPNGCGKTSLLRALTGYLTPTVGEIAVLGQRYGESDWRDLRLKIGIVSSSLQASIPFAEPAIETVISGKYAQLDLWVKTTRADFADARKLLRVVCAESLANREWGFLSQGERQRILIARALMARPALLILDEPCAGLDPVAREHFLAMLDQLAAHRGPFTRLRPHHPPFLLVTHHVEEITPAFTHALLMRAGTTVAAGPLHRTLKPRTLSTAFGVPLRLTRKAHRYHLTLTPSLRQTSTL